MTIPRIPRCPDYYTRGCPDCKRYAYANRARRAGWDPRGDKTRVAEYIEQLIAGGMSYGMIAERSGVSKSAVFRIHRGNTDSVYQVIGEAILGVQPAGPNLRVHPIGAARRLQAITRAGLGSRGISHQLEISVWRVQDWRLMRFRTIRLARHRAIDGLYQDILVNGLRRPSRIAIASAVRYGWLPFEAWTDATIDDPDALPYGDPAASAYLDMVKISQVRARLAPVADLTQAEQQYMYDQHIQGGGTARSFRDRYRPVPIAILRRLEMGGSDEDIRLVG